MLKIAWTYRSLALDGPRPAFQRLAVDCVFKIGKVELAALGRGRRLVLEQRRLVVDALHFPGRGKRRRTGPATLPSEQWDHD